MNTDKYNEIINGESTYKEIANKLLKKESVIIGWTDEKYTHLDILFTRGVYKKEGNSLQRGLRKDDLFVSIVGLGVFGFCIDNCNKFSGFIKEMIIWI